MKCPPQIIVDDILVPHYRGVGGFGHFGEESPCTHQGAGRSDTQTHLIGAARERRGLSETFKTTVARKKFDSDTFLVLF